MDDVVDELTCGEACLPGGKDDDDDFFPTRAVRSDDEKEDDTHYGCDDRNLTVEFLEPGPKGASILVRHARSGETPALSPWVSGSCRRLSLSRQRT